MTIPKNFGISKISHMRGEEENRYEGREGSHSSSRAGQQRDYMPSGPLSFQLDNANDAVALLQPPSFNMLYVTTPKIALLQTPQFRAIADLWSETVELVKPLFRFGLPETSLKTKCPYYDEKLYASNSGALLPMDRTRVLINSIHSGYLPGSPHSSHQHSSSSSGSSKPMQQQEQELSESSSQAQQRQPGQSVGMFGVSTVAFLASQVMGGIKQKKQHQQQEQQQVVDQQAADAELRAAEQQSQAAIPKGRFLVPDIPSGQLVLALNLMAYWSITNQSRRSSMGGAMPQ